MQSVPDLRSGPPRRWTETVGGVQWLPRFIDKARALRAGTLGVYLFGQSPIDAEFLKTAGLSYRRFMVIVDAHGADDAAVLAEIEAQRPGAADRLRAWSNVLPKRHAVFMALLDIDDGYKTTWYSQTLRKVAGALIVPALIGFARKAWPVKL